MGIALQLGQQALVRTRFLWGESGLRGVLTRSVPHNPQTLAQPLALLPRPQRQTGSGKPIAFASGLRPDLGLDSKALRIALEALAPRVGRRDPSASAALRIEVRPDLQLCGAVRPESYRLRVDSAGVHIEATDEAGAFYALKTVQALSRLQDDSTLELPELTLEDWPDFSNRAVSFDVSRDKVPTMDTLRELIDMLSCWKINQFQLYMEHVFAYAGHEEVWRDASAFTAEEIRELDAYCRERLIELVPNQNSLAHFHRWLKHDRYRPLSEVPEGIDHPFCKEPEPFSLCPTDPRSLELISDLYRQLLPNFSSKLIHVGLDEPMDLGTGRSKAACEERTKQRVFLDYLRSIRELVHGEGRDLQFWAEWILAYPDYVSELPNDVIAMEWGYEATHPFEEELALLSSAVSRHYVCPGTSSWNSLGGRTSTALANLLRAGRTGRAAGSEGYMITDWGDNGHWQPLPISYAGFLMGASVAWNTSDTPSPGELAQALDHLVFDDEAGVLGGVALALGDAHRAAKSKTVNGSVPYFLLHFADEELPHERLPDLSISGLEACLCAIDRAVAPLDDSRSPHTDVIEELSWCADLMRTACQLGIHRLETPGSNIGDIPRVQRDSLAVRLREHADKRRELWLRRNRPGGLDDSLERFDRIIDLLR